MAKRRWSVYVLGIMVMMLLFSSNILVAGTKWKMMLNLKGIWKFNIGDNTKWAEPGYDDGDWENIRVPSNWEDQGFYGYNGYAWYRSAFDGALLQNKSLRYNLFLGYIDDVDEVYLNGHKIGHSGAFPPKYHTAYNAFRNYVIPEEYINFKGKNTLAVRIFDAEVAGGIISGDVGIVTDEEEMALAVNLRGLWDFTLVRRKFGDFSESNDYSLKRTPPVKAEWSKLMAPGSWEDQGYANYDGSTWYRKQFFIPKELDGHDLILLMGKIDDFDQTYFNGKLVGSTNNYDKLRIYTVPSEMFKAGAMNILLVYVDDPQGLGGLRQGPLGLMKQSDFTRYMRWRR